MTTWFIVLALFFPRITLLVCWFTGDMPANDTSFALDVFAAIFAPRLLMSWWAHTAGQNGLALLFFLFSLFAGGGQTSAASRSRDD